MLSLHKLHATNACFVLFRIFCSVCCLLVACAVCIDVRALMRTRTHLNTIDLSIDGLIAAHPYSHIMPMQPEWNVYLLSVCFLIEHICSLRLMCSIVNEKLEKLKTTNHESDNTHNTLSGQMLFFSFFE